MAISGSDAVWLITGSSTGFGRELAQLVLSRGERVVATARNPDSLAGLVKGNETRCLALPLDVTKPDQIAAAVKSAETAFSRIDVLVNNAGYGYLTSFEEGEEDQYRKLFETNLFGLIALTRAVLPGMRERRQGHIVNLSSVAGFTGMASSAYYAGSKFAVEGISESLAAEVGPLGISVTLVEPSAFRTDFSGRSLHAPDAVHPDYRETVGVVLDHLTTNASRHPGDPKKAVAAIHDLVHSPNPPLRLPLGSNAVKLARAKLAAWTENIDACEQTARDADYSGDSN